MYVQTIFFITVFVLALSIATGYEFHHAATIFPFLSSNLPPWRRQLQSSTPRLNYFFAFQILDAKILEEVREVQKRMMAAKFIRGGTEESGELFRDTLDSSATLHFTLHVMELKDDNDKAKAIEAGDRVWNVFKTEIAENPIIAKVHGMGHFDNIVNYPPLTHVLFAKLEGDEEIRRVTELATRLKKECEALNIRGEVRQTFVPHMTIAEISKSKTLQKKGIKTFPREIWSASEFTDFGSQEVNGIQLLAMGRKDSSGYYTSLANFPF